MQRVLEKMAKKLNEYDEASLMVLWQHYAEQVHDFEPTKRWEEAAIALCLVQAVHWKNQLFNHHLALSSGRAEKEPLPPMPEFFGKQKKSDSQASSPERKKATVLRFPHQPDAENDLEFSDDDGHTDVSGEKPEDDKE